MTQNEALDILHSVMARYPNGLSRLMFRVQLYKAAHSFGGAEAGELALELLCSSPQDTDRVLRPLGFCVKGSRIVPHERLR